MNFKPVESMMNSNNKYIHDIGHYIAYLWQYRSIFVMTVKNDFKGRFKYTVLGYFWHLLNPLTQIIIYYLIFTVIFGRDIPNYWVYLSTGMFAFSFFLSCSAGASKCIIEKSAMVTKMAMAREIIVLSKVAINLITLAISYFLLIILMIIFGTGITVNILYVPVIVLLLAIFNTGVAFITSSLTVYIRDVANALSLLFGCMMFALPIMYLAESRSTPAMDLFWSINPLYYFIEVIHDTFYSGISPDMFQLFMCLIFSVSMMLAGLYIFKKLENGFAERL